MILTVIIVSFNTKDLLKACLTSLLTQTSPTDEIIVVDNGSSDGSVELVKQDFPQVKLQVNSGNRGYAQANNQGIQASSGELFLLLNSDTLLKPNALKSMKIFFKNHPEVGIASPRLLNSDESLQPNGGSLPNLFNLFAWIFFLDDLPLVQRFFTAYHQQYPGFYQTTRPTGWVTGASMFIRRKLIDQIGPLNPEIFMYSEDTELCLRAQKAGWQVYTVGSAVITHLSHGSGSSDKAILGEISGLKFIFSHHFSRLHQLLLSIILRLGLVWRLFIFGTILRDRQKYDVYQKALKLA